jgi:hypothetical protein
MPTPLRVFVFDRRGRRRSRPNRCQSLEDCPPKLPHRRYKPGRGALLAREVRDCAESKQSTIAWLHLPRFCSCYRFSAQVPGRIVSSPSCTGRRYRVQQTKRCMEHRSSQRANRFLGPAWRGERIWLASLLIVLSRGIPSSLPRCPGSRRQVLARAERPFISVVSPPVAAELFVAGSSTSKPFYLCASLSPDRHLHFLFGFIYYDRRRFGRDWPAMRNVARGILAEHPFGRSKLGADTNGGVDVNLHPTEDLGCDAFRQPRSVSVRSRDLVCSTSQASSFEKLMMSSFGYAVQIDNNPVIKRFIIPYLYRP